MIRDWDDLISKVEGTAYDLSEMGGRLRKLSEADTLTDEEYHDLFWKAQFIYGDTGQRLYEIEQILKGVKNAT